MNRHIIFNNIVINARGHKLAFDTMLELMDNDLCWHLDDGGGDLSGEEKSPADEQQFFEWYCRLHREKYGEEFAPNKW